MLAWHSPRMEVTTGLKKNSSISSVYWSKCRLRLWALSRPHPSSCRRASIGSITSKYFSPTRSCSRIAAASFDGSGSGVGTVGGVCVTTAEHATTPAGAQIKITS